jgi:transcription elongation factor GreA
MTSRLPHDPIPSAADPGSTPKGGYTPMTAASLDELRDELDRLRTAGRIETARQLRDARVFGSGPNNDEFHAIHEERMVLDARIASLEETIARADVVDPADAGSGVAVIGSTVLIEDLDSGALSQYLLVSAHQSRGPDTVSAGSPMGQALVGTTPGAVVAIDLPNGRTRQVRVVDVINDAAAGSRSQAAA